jgi:hypothetical protein
MRRTSRRTLNPDILSLFLAGREGHGKEVAARPSGGTAKLVIRNADHFSLPS